MDKDKKEIKEHPKVNLLDKEETKAGCGCGCMTPNNRNHRPPAKKE